MGIWNIINENFRGWSTSSFAIDSNNTAVMYANSSIETTGDELELIGGIIKSTDSGFNWHPLAGLEAYGNYSILIDPGNSSIVYAGGHGVVYKSTDAGFSWKKIIIDPDLGWISYPIILIADYKKPSILYATDNNSCKILKSVDGGENWVNLDLESKIDNASDIKSIATSMRKSNTVYVLLTGDELYKSNNGGKSWKKLKNNLKGIHQNIVMTSNPNIIYLNSASGFYCSRNGGKSWELRSESGGRLVAVDQQNHEIVYVYSKNVDESKTGIYKSTDGGRTWKNVSKGLPLRNEK